MFKYFRKKIFLTKLYKRYDLALYYTKLIKEAKFTLIDNEIYQKRACHCFAILCAACRGYINDHPGYTAMWQKRFQQDLIDHPKTEPFYGITAEDDVLIILIEDLLVSQIPPITSHPISFHSFITASLDQLHAKRTVENHTLLAELVASFLSDCRKRFIPTADKVSRRRWDERRMQIVQNRIAERYK